MTLKDLYTAVSQQEDDFVGGRKQANLLEFDAKYLESLKAKSDSLYEEAFSELVTLTEYHSEKGFENGFKTAVSLLLSGNI